MKKKKKEKRGEVVLSDLIARVLARCCYTHARDDIGGCLRSLSGVDIVDSVDVVLVYSMNAKIMTLLRCAMGWLGD